jgi:hypothetical protein
LHALKSVLNAMRDVEAPRFIFFTAREAVKYKR